MAKVAVAVRLSPETVELVDAQAKARGVSRQVLLESAVASFLDDCRRGVPDLVATPVEVQPSTPASVRSLVDRHPGLQIASSLRRDPDAMARQAKLNAAKGRAK